MVPGDLDRASTTSVAERLGAYDDALGLRCDVTKASEVQLPVGTATERFGRLDIMVNNAGITRDATLHKMSERAFDQVIDVHLKGTWNGTRAAAEIMRENQRGAIVNMSSLSVKVGNPGQANYSAAKAGIVGLTKAAAKELGRHGVRVNAISRGLIRTPMTEALPQQIWDAKVGDIPLGRAGEPTEIGDAAVFLASKMSSYEGAVIESGAVDLYEPGALRWAATIEER